MSKQVAELSAGHASSPWTGVSHFLPTSQRIIQFAEGREPRPTDRIVYMPGGCDVALQLLCWGVSISDL